MKQTNQLSRNLAGLLLVISISTTSLAQVSPTDSVRALQDSREKTPEDRAIPEKGKPEADKHSPQVKIVTPKPGDSFKASDDMKIEIVANDPDGWTSQAAFFANDRLISEQTLAFVRQPDDGEDQHYALIWSDVPKGKYELHAIVTDDEGNKGRSRPVVVHVREDNGNGNNKPNLTVVQVRTSDGKAFETQDHEEANPGSFMISRDGDLTHPLEVHYHMRGAAVNGQDYRELPGVVTIAEGESSVEVPIQPINDDHSEGTEQVVLILDDIACITIFPPSPACYQIGRKDAARLNIFDNDRGSNFPPKAGMITPNKHQRFQAPASISLKGGAFDKDGWIGAFQFLVNERVLHEGTINFLVAPDPGQRQHFDYLWEDVPPGTYEIALSVTDNEGTTTTSHPVKVVVIGDQDLPEVSVFVRDALASETTGNENSKPNTATFRFRRTGKTDEPLEITYRVSGSAENGVDYENLMGSLVIEANQRWGKVVLNPIPDDIDEGGETVIITLVTTDSPSYAIGRMDAAKALVTDKTPGRKATKILKDGSIHLRLPSVPGEGFLLEVSENLRDWKVVDTGVSEENALDIIENHPGQGRGKYFRIRKAPEEVAED